MKQSCNKLFVFFVLNAFVALASALPYGHLITLDPADLSLVPKETVVGTELHVTPNAARTGDYEYKQVPLVSRKRAKEIAPTEEKTVVEAEATARENTQIVATANEKEVVEHSNNGELINSIEDIEENTQFTADNAVLKPHKMKHPTPESGNPIYITIPIYVNSMPGLPVTLSIGGQQFAHKTNRVSLRGTLKREVSPTSLYNKLP